MGGKESIDRKRIMESLTLISIRNKRGQRKPEEFFRNLK